MKKWNLSLVVFVLVMFCGCGNTTAKNPEPAQPIGKMQTEDIAVELPVSEPEPEPDIAPLLKEEAVAEEPETEEDPSSPNYVYRPTEYDISYHEFDENSWTAIVDNPRNDNTLYLKDEFGLPRQSYFWIDESTFDYIGYFFACGFARVDITQVNICAYVSPEGAGDTTYQPTVNLYYGDAPLEPGETGYTEVLFSAFLISERTDKRDHHTKELEIGEPIYLYSQQQLPGTNPVDRYYIDLLPAYINAALSTDEDTETCQLDGYGIPHTLVFRGTGTAICAESE